MKFLLVLSTALLTLAGFTPILHAQDAVDPKRTAAAEELLQAMHSDEMMTKILQGQKDGVMKMTASMMPKDMSPDALKRFQDIESSALDVVFKQLTWDSLKSDFVQVYSEVYTEQELHDLAAFYKTPLGQKLIDKTPEIQTKTMEIMQRRMLTLMPAIQAAVQDAASKLKSGDQAPQQ